jgi:hypothetical protein
MNVENVDIILLQNIDKMEELTGMDNFGSSTLQIFLTCKMGARGSISFSTILPFPLLAFFPSHLLHISGVCITGECKLITREC